MPLRCHTVSSLTATLPNPLGPVAVRPENLASRYGYEEMALGVTAAEVLGSTIRTPARLWRGHSKKSFDITAVYP